MASPNAVHDTYIIPGDDSLFPVMLDENLAMAELKEATGEKPAPFDASTLRV